MLDILPKDGLNIILTSLPYESIVSLSAVCKHLRKLCEDDFVWKRIYIDKFNESYYPNCGYRYIDLYKIRYCTDTFIKNVPAKYKIIGTPHTYNISFTNVDISYLDMDVLPKEVYTFMLLDHLSIQHANMRKVSTYISNLKQLKVLNLSHNNIESCEPFVQLSTLTVLDLSHNKIKTIPSDIQNLKKLTSLNMSSNEIVHVPDEMKKLSKLNRLMSVSYTHLRAHET